MAVISHGTWGERVVTRKDDYSLTTVLFLQPHKRCSFHYHDHAYNQFFVISGKLGVLTDMGPNEDILTIVNPRQTFTVPPGIKHEFQTYDEPTVVEEIAYVEYTTSDIIRDRFGGDLK